MTEAGERKIHGNGAREAVTMYFDKFWLGRESHPGQILAAPDWFLSWLWREGFKIVPVEIPSSLRVILSPADHQIALARISELMDAKADTEEGRELDVLAELVRIYESGLFSATTAADAITKEGRDVIEAALSLRDVYLIPVEDRDVGEFARARDVLFAAVDALRTKEPT